MVTYPQLECAGSVTWVVIHRGRLPQTPPPPPYRPFQRHSLQLNIAFSLVDLFSVQIAPGWG